MGLYILVFFLAWIVIGIVIHGLMFLLEIAAFLVRDPGYGLAIQKEFAEVAPSEHPTNSWWNALRPFLLWPPKLIFIIRAIANKRSGAEQVIFDLKAAEAAHKQAQKEFQLLESGQQPIDRQWVVFSKNENGIGYVNISRFFMPMPNGRRAMHVRVTHSVWETADKSHFICFRAMVAPDKNIPMVATGSKTSAFDWCEADTEWLSLSAPGNEEQRRKVGLEQLQRLESGEQQQL